MFRIKFGGGVFGACFREVSNEIVIMAWERQLTIALSAADTVKDRLLVTDRPDRRDELVDEGRQGIVPKLATEGISSVVAAVKFYKYSAIVPRTTTGQHRQASERHSPAAWRHEKP